MVVAASVPRIAIGSWQTGGVGEECVGVAAVASEGSGAPGSTRGFTAEATTGGGGDAPVPSRGRGEEDLRRGDVGEEGEAVAGAGLWN